ncbi:hypothetical protein HSE3_gp142 [Bacillus phage vB_BceM-HSE3]|nr:hypothetical protein HSE3_gp142 [Bacillus phage vB_BceM-HSE3]
MFREGVEFNNLLKVHEIEKRFAYQPADAETFERIKVYIEQVIMHCGSNGIQVYVEDPDTYKRLRVRSCIVKQDSFAGGVKINPVLA